MKNSDKKGAGNKGYSLVNKLKSFIVENYEPVNDPSTAEYHFTTLEIYNQLQRILPDKRLFTPSDVAMWMDEYGFVFYDFGGLRFEWLIDSKSKLK